MLQNSACSAISNHTHAAIALLGIHQPSHCQRQQQDTHMACVSQTTAAHGELQLSLPEDSVDAMTSTQIITTDNTHFFNTEEFPTPERDRVALQEGFYMVSSMFPQPTAVRL